jgi:hypothetical protein
MRRVPVKPFSIRPVGPDGLRVTCPTCGTRHHLSPSPSDMWDLTACVSRIPVGPFSISIRPVGPDGLHFTCGPFLHPTRDPTACVSLVDPFSIRPVGPDGLCVTCTCGTFLHLHPTCGTRRLACHLLSSGFNKFKLKKNYETWESNPGPRARNRLSSPLR